MDSATGKAQPCRRIEGEWRTTIRREAEYRYVLHLPEGYEQGGDWPLIVFLHGSGQRGNDLRLVEEHGPWRVTRPGSDKHFLVVGPQCPAEQRWQTEGLSAMLDELEESYRVDRQRIYLTGLSMGGYGTWYWACAEPRRFAAIAPICGGGEERLAGYLVDVPIWAFHGARDDIIPMHRSQRMVETVNLRGGQARLTVYKDAFHDSWTRTYENELLYEWFLQHKREDMKVGR